MKRLFTRPSQAAFTLVELFVVIAIIAILAGILVPIVQQARDTARLRARYGVASPALRRLHTPLGLESATPAFCDCQKRTGQCLCAAPRTNGEKGQNNDAIGGNHPPAPGQSTPAASASEGN